MLAALDHVELLELALLALHPKSDLLCGLGLLVEDGLGLATEPTLLPVVPVVEMILVIIIAKFFHGK